MNTTFWKGVALWFSVGLIVGLLIGMAIGWRIDQRVAQITSEDAVKTATSTDMGLVNDSGVSVTLNDQPAGYAALISQITLPQSAWISVREILPSGDLGKVLGTVRRDAGTYTNVVVNLLRATVPEASYALVLYADNGKKTFDAKSLTIIQGMDGKEATTDFVATTPVAPSGR
jgi:hypothetical protein